MNRSCFLMVVFAAALPLCGQQASSKAKPASRAAAGSTLDPGGVSNGTYRNTSLGFAYKLPYGWVDRTTAMQDISADAEQAAVLLAAFERPPEASGETINSAVVIAAESVASYPGLKTAADYSGPLGEVTSKQGLKAVGEPYEAMVSGRSCVRFDYAKPVGSVTLHQSTLVLLEKSHIVSVTFIAESDDEVQALLEGLSFGGKKPSTVKK